MKPLVGYGTGPRTIQRETEAARWAKANGVPGTLLWRRDPSSLLKAPVERRHRLHQALFLIRAGLAEVLWLPSWEVLGGILANQELVCAEVWASGGRVVVDGVEISPDDPIPGEQRMLRDLAGAGRRLHQALDPRQDWDSELEEPDLGAADTEWDQARLAFKLREDFRLTLAEVAHVLNLAGFTTTTGRLYSQGTVKHLLARHTDDLRVRRRSEISEAEPSPTTTSL